MNEMEMSKVSLEKKLLLDIMKLDNFEMQIALLVFYHDGQVAMSHEQIINIGGVGGLTLEKMLFKANYWLWF